MQNFVQGWVRLVMLQEDMTEHEGYPDAHAHFVLPVKCEVGVSGIRPPATSCMNRQWKRRAHQDSWRCGAAVPFSLFDIA